MFVLRWLLPSAMLLSLACVDDPLTIEREVSGGWIVLAVDDFGDGHLFFKNNTGKKKSIACERLEGAWGLWLTDIDGDKRAELIITLKKKARFDPVLENRLHVYSVEDGQCVPAWRGTRLAGRFDDIRASLDDGDRLWALERVGKERRIVLYRWNNFGYLMEKILWQGDSIPPPGLRKVFEG